MKLKVRDKASERYLEECDQEQVAPVPSDSVLQAVIRRIFAWSAHFFTAIGGVCGLLALVAVHHGELKKAFWFMGAAIIIDAVDGTFARAANVKKYAARIDGELLDNIIDYLNYVIVPAFFIMASEILPQEFRLIGASLIVLSSAYQFSQRDAKTKDHFFKGFPSYWNIVVFYLYFWQLSPQANLLFVVVFSVLEFVPIKYLYPSRLEYMTAKPALRVLMFWLTIGWGVATIFLLWLYPQTNSLLVAYSIGYIALYAFVSLYRTYFPLLASEK